MDVLAPGESTILKQFEQFRLPEGNGYNMSLVMEFMARRVENKANEICSSIGMLKQTEGLEDVQSIERSGVYELSDPDLLANDKDLHVSIEIVRDVFENIFTNDEGLALAFKSAYGIDNLLKGEDLLARASKIHILRVLSKVKDELPDFVLDPRLRRKSHRNVSQAIVLIFLER